MNITFTNSCFESEVSHQAPEEDEEDDDIDLTPQVSSEEDEDEDIDMATPGFMGFFVWFGTTPKKQL